MKYTFKVKDYEEIDLARISRENPESDVLIVNYKTISNNNFDAKLLLSKKFLSNFHFPEETISQKICNEPLSFSWGAPLCDIHNFKAIRSVDIPEIIKEIRLAKNHLKEKQKKYTITVSELNLDKPKPSSKNHPDVKDWRIYQRILRDLDMFKFTDEKPTSNNESAEKVPTNEKDTSFLIHHEPNSDHYKERWQNFNVSYNNLTLQISYEDKTKSPIETVVINGQVYEKEVPF
jgi:hypothetical protein